MEEIPVRAESMSGLKLNLGSGTMIKDPAKGWVNLDTMVFYRGKDKNRISTTVLGKIEALPFKANSFVAVLSSHVIEHFEKAGAVEMLRIIHRVLRPGGVAVIEGPCILGGYWYYWQKNKNIQRLIEMLYPTRNPGKFGDGWHHKSGWTGPLVAEEMEKIGYKIRHVGPGMTHGFGKRDFRVEGVK
jgi:SAM-dependent methyltransferase